MGTGKKQTDNKIKKYRKPKNINLGMIIFGLIFVYIVICVGLSFKEKKIRGYVVAEGSLSASRVYEGIILRSETVVTGDKAGYVYYYPREGERVAVGDLIYTVDEAGQLSNLLNETAQEGNTLSESELTQLRSELVNFSHGFSPENFGATYDFKYSLKNAVLKLANTSLADHISELSAQNGTIIQNYYAGMSGIVTYWMDGYEELTVQDLRSDILEQKEYKKQQLSGNELIEQGEAIYKLNTSETWSVCIPYETTEAERLIEEENGYIKVRFLKNQYESWAEMKAVTGEDGDGFLQLIFNNSMLTFVNDRFLDVELLTQDQKGLKIPNSSIVEKEFFVVPTEYIIEGGKNGNQGVLRQSYMEDGTISSEFVETSIYNYEQSESVYYLDTSQLQAGDVLLKQDSTETFIVSERATMIGVYNINKGYADFRRIEILSQNDEYAIVKSNSTYGLNVYDYIVLDADMVDENEFLYE